MTTGQLVIVCVTVLLLALLAASVRTDPLAAATSSIFEGVAVGDDVALYLVSGETFRGAVTEVGSERVTLSGVSVVVSGAESRMGGLVHIAASSVTCVQSNIPPTVEQRRARIA